MTATYPYMITATSITVVVKGKSFDVHRSAANYGKLRDAIRAGASEDDVYDLVNLKRMVAKAFAGKVEIDGDTVLLDGEPVNNFLADRILEHFEGGFDVEPLKAFLANLYRNPNGEVRDQLYGYLEYGKNPITPDGKFLAFKRVQDDYHSFHSGTGGKVYYGVGTVVEMPREECDLDPHRTCSAGLHFCSRDYLNHFWGGSGRILIVEIDPADVTAIPTDYNNTKGRTCRMQVIGEVDAAKVDETLVTVVENGSYEAPELVPAAYALCSQCGAGGACDCHDDAADPSVVAPGDEVTVPCGDPNCPVCNSEDPFSTWEDGYEDGKIEAEEGVPFINDVGSDDYREGYNAGYFEVANSAEYDEGSSIPGAEILNQMPDAVAAVFEDEGARVILFSEAGLRVLLGEREPADDIVDADFVEVDDELVFDIGKTTMTASEIVKLTNELGQRGFAREYGVPRTTLQKWLAKIHA